MLAELDHGTRCDEHVGEAFRVRCSDCDELAAEAQTLAAMHPHALLECQLHAGYFHYPATSCDRCARDGIS
jgi:hypothetical protein